MRWFIGLVVALAVLILGVRGAAQTGTQANLCVTLSSEIFARAYTLDSQIGSVLPEYRQGGESTTRLIKDKIVLRRQGIDNQLLWLQANRTQPVMLEAGVFDWTFTLGAPDRTRISYIVSSKPPQLSTGTWAVLNVDNGHVDRIIIDRDDLPFFTRTSNLFLVWAPDSQRIAAVATNPGTGAVRLYLRDHLGSTWERIELVNIRRVRGASWSPDSQTLVIFGSDATASNMGWLFFYSANAGRMISRQAGSADEPQQLIGMGWQWSPDSKYGFIFVSDRRDYSGLDVYGIDGSSYVHFPAAPNLVGWRRTDSQLVFIDSSQISKTRQLVEYNVSTGRRKTLIDTILRATLFMDRKSFLIASQLPDGNVVVDRYSLGDGNQTRVLSGIVQFDNFASNVPSEINAVRWYDRQGFHITFLDASGQIRRDFVGLAPGGENRYIGTPDLSVYKRVVNTGLWSIDLLNLETGTWHPLLTTTAEPWISYYDESSRTIGIQTSSENGGQIQRYTRDGVLVPIGTTHMGEHIYVSPDGQHAVWWSEKGGLSSATARIELRSITGAPRMLQIASNNNGWLIVNWSADSAYFVLIYSIQLFDGRYQTVAAIYNARGNFLSQTEIIDDYVPALARWTDCK